MQDSVATWREIVDTAGISTALVHAMLHEMWQVKQLCVRWMPRLVTDDQATR